MWRITLIKCFPALLIIAIIVFIMPLTAISDIDGNVSSDQKLNLRWLMLNEERSKDESILKFEIIEVLAIGTQYQYDGFGMLFIDGMPSIESAKMVNYTIHENVKDLTFFLDEMFNKNTSDSITAKSPPAELHIFSKEKKIISNSYYYTDIYGGAAVFGGENVIRLGEYLKSQNTTSKRVEIDKIKIEKKLRNIYKEITHPHLKAYILIILYSMNVEIDKLISDDVKLQTGVSFYVVQKKKIDVKDREFIDLTVGNIIQNGSLENIEIIVNAIRRAPKINIKYLNEVLMNKKIYEKIANLKEDYPEQKDVIYMMLEDIKKRKNETSKPKNDGL